MAEDAQKDRHILASPIRGARDSRRRWRPGMVEAASRFVDHLFFSVDTDRDGRFTVRQRPPLSLCFDSTYVHCFRATDTATTNEHRSNIDRTQPIYITTMTRSRFKRVFSARSDKRHNETSRPLASLVTCQDPFQTQNVRYRDIFHG